MKTPFSSIPKTAQGGSQASQGESLPNVKTQKAIAAAKAGKTQKHPSFEALRQELKNR